MPAGIIEIQYLKKEEFPLWDEFVKSSPQGTFFNTTNWLIAEETRKFYLV
jgi:hypothetical protein